MRYFSKGPRIESTAVIDIIGWYNPRGDTVGVIPARLVNGREYSTTGQGCSIAWT